MPLRPALFVFAAACYAAPAGPAPAAEAILSIAEEVQVSAATQGVLLKLDASEGTLLAAGQPLLEIDGRRERLALAQAEVELRRAAEQAASDVDRRHALKAKELADSEYRRALDIDAASPSSISDRELNQLRLSAEVAAIEVERAEQDRQIAGHELRLKQEALRLARLDLDNHRVAAPIAGMVVEVHRRPGEWVNRGDPVVTIVRVDRLRAEALLPVAQATLDLVGRPAEFATAAGQQRVTATGHVVFVNPKADPVTAQARVWVELSVEDRRLRPGLRGAIRILPAGAPQPPAIATNQPPAKPSHERAD
ncbi:MAG: HlyD family efflux transporter periplasmic adaptor subunit [Planctomycetota bacterium]